jgi:RNA polymerase sigma factor (TIGR02999 family)
MGLPAQGFLVQSGETGASAPAQVQELVESVYPELRRAARALMSRERPNHTLQPTALVHEAVLKIVGVHVASFNDSEHFFCVVVRQMRRILIDHARSISRQKRSPDASQLDFPESIGFDFEQAMIVDQLLDRLAGVDPRSHKVVLLRYFGGLTANEIAAVLGISPASVDRDWTFARRWMYGELESR